MAKYIFLVSTGRTATKAVSDFLAANAAGCTAYHEPRPTFARRAPELIAGPHSRADRIYLGLPRRMRRLKEGKPVYVECNHHLFSAIDLIRKTFRNTSVIHIIRDGRATVRSWLNKGRFTHCDNFMTPMQIPGSGVSLEEWLAWSPVKKVAWSWAVVNGFIATQAPDIVIRYESIFDAGENALGRALEQSSPEHFNAARVNFAKATRIHKTPRARYPPFEEWPDEWQADFWAVAEPQMRRFGYI